MVETAPHESFTKMTHGESQSRRKRMLFRVLAIFLGIGIGFLCSEVFLRLYPPASLRIRGSRISLPVSTTIAINNRRVEKLDAEIVHRRNAIGFRGENPPRDFDEYLTIVSVGGSTTECYYLSDDKTWTAQLGALLEPHVSRVWVNNAGLDGHSTFGHFHLLDQYLVALKPKVVLFLVGLNDIGTEQPHDFDENLQRIPRSHHGFVKRVYLKLVEHSATFAVLDSYRRHRRAVQAGVVHGNVDHGQLLLSVDETLKFSEAEKSALLDQHRSKFLEAYQQRVRTLIRASRANLMEPVLITQPALYGSAIDPQTGVDLGKVRYREINGELRWEIVELYNDITRKVAAEENVLLVDVARQMPKDSICYYDHHHFTNEGAKIVAELVEKELTPYLKERFPGYAIR